MYAAFVEAALPDPSSPTVVPIAAVLGGFVGASLARLRGESIEQRRGFAEIGAYWATALSFLLYLTFQLIDVH